MHDDAPPGAAGRVADDAVPYNAAAAKVMRVAFGEDRVINDLHAFVTANTTPIQQPADVHFTDEGSALYSLAKSLTRYCHSSIQFRNLRS